MKSPLTLDALLTLRSEPARQALQARLQTARDAGYQRALADIEQALQILSSPLTSPKEQIAYERVNKLLELKAHQCRTLGAPQDATDPSHGKPAPQDASVRHIIRQYENIDGVWALVDACYDFADSHHEASCKVAHAQYADHSGGILNTRYEIATERS